jgi:hypothetical protein
MAMGFLFLLLSDSLYSNAGLEGSMFPAWFHTREFRRSMLGRLYLAMRVVTGLLAGPLFWGGLYSCLLYAPPLDSWTLCDHMCVSPPPPPPTHKHSHSHSHRHYHYDRHCCCRAWRLLHFLTFCDFED